MVYRWSKILGISITGVGALLLGFALWAMFITTAPAEQFIQDPRFAVEYMTYYQGLTVFGTAMIIMGGILYMLHRRSLKEIRESMKKMEKVR